MNDIACTYGGDREQTLIAYLYNDIDPAERSIFDAHLVMCSRCRRDLDALDGVRTQLARWSPPEPDFESIRNPRSAPRQTPGALSSLKGAHQSLSWRAVPIWAQVAAALLFLGVSAAIANLDVRYDQNGLTVRTGWSKAVNSTATTANTPADANRAAGDAPWRAELTALEAQLRSEIRSARAAAASVPTRSAAATDADVLRRVHALIDESERKQQRELALRVAEVFRDVNAQRQADLTKIDRNLAFIQNSTGVEILKQREATNYLMKVSQRR
jgi:putative zinc finger protein